MKTHLSLILKSFWVMICLGLIISAPGTVQAQSASAQASLEAFVETLRLMDFPVKDAAHHEELVKKAGSSLDLDSVGQKAVASHWAQMTESQQKDFRELFSKLIETIAYRSSHDFLKKAQITYPEMNPDAAGVTIKSRVKQEGEEIDVEVLYHLAEIGGSWKVDDVILDGVSIVEDLKYQFDKIIEKSSYPGLIQTMQERLAKETEINSVGAA